MADTRLRYRTDILPLRIESGRLFIPGELASEILNLYLTEEGTLRSIWGPCPYVPPYVVEFTEVIKDMGESKKNADSKRVSMSTTQASLFNTDYYVDKLSSTDRNALESRVDCCRPAIQGYESGPTPLPLLWGDAWSFPCPT